MYNLIKEFPQQLLEAVEIGEKARLHSKPNEAFRNIVICGLGGSGIGGNLVSELLRNELRVPVIVNKGYSLPAFVDANSLLILCSYSGNTEETLQCANEAIKKGLSPSCITSGGNLAEIAGKNDLDTIKIPPGLPPRAALGYSVTQLFFLLNHHGLINGDFKASLIRTSSHLQAEQNKIMEEAEFLAGKLQKKLLILYTEDRYESVALRIKQQVNENGKMQCWYNVVPELNHNELVGWREPYKELAVILLRTSDEYARNTRRILFQKEVMAKVSKEVYEINAKGSDGYEKRFYLIHFGDWLTYHLALLQGYDPTEIDVLIKLKEHMSSVI